MQYTLDDYDDCWTASIHLKRWAGFRACDQVFARLGEGLVSDGATTLVFAPEGRDNSPLTDAERDLVDRFLAQEEAVSAAVQIAILNAYPALQDDYDYDEEERATCMPEVKTIDDLKPLIGLKNIYLHQMEKDGLPYAGYELQCTWDDEHGLGVLMHGCRCVETGGVDTAITLWIAEKDAQEAG